MLGKALKSIVLIAFLLFGSQVNSLPLLTSTRWIVDAASGHRVKLHCVNWAAHLQPMLAEGLDKKPLRVIAARVASLGFNCVRITWATYMFTHIRSTNISVAQSLDSLGVKEAVMGIASNNPSLLNLTVIQAYDTVVDELGMHGLMVVLDNHISRPQWCCGYDDGNGFFGDAYFDPQEWLEGLGTVAKRFKGKPQVVAMSMRNELRGPRQNKLDWYRYVCRGARKIHEVNPDVLVIVSGLNYDSDLSFLRRRPLALDLDKKLVYEVHWYSFSEGMRQQWEVQRPDLVCSDAIRSLDHRAGIIVQGENPFPLFISEFGVDQRGVNRADNRFLSCFLAFVVERDLDWAMWALQGSYYLRNGRAGFDETYGVLDVNWEHPRNPRFRERFRLIQEMIQDPRSNVLLYQLVYHPLSGRCLEANANVSIQLSDCLNRSRWSYTGDRTPIWLMGTSLCLRAVDDGLPVILSTDCSNPQSIWNVVRSSKFHVSTIDGQGGSLCLENNPSSNSSTILTKKCCFRDDSSCDENAETQWFKLISTNLN